APPIGPVFNLAPGPMIRLSDMLVSIRDYGYPVVQRPLAEWRTHMQQHGADAHLTTLAFFDRQSGDNAETPSFSIGRVRCEHVLNGLAGSGIECPPIDHTLLCRYLDYCVETGLLPPPHSSQ
ncbi:MAG: hypothetical protein MI924_20890, partial [Chloroflexales bacterium]|nr:hypothetical protein [Chloroflexales bacterium]